MTIWYLIDAMFRGKNRKITGLTDANRSLASEVHMLRQNGYRQDGRIYRLESRCSRLQCQLDDIRAERSREHEASAIREGQAAGRVLMFRRAGAV